MDIKRYIIIQAIKTEDNKLIPIWDENIVYSKSDDYGATLSINGDRKTHFNIVECVYDLKTRKIEMGIEIDYYPTNEELPFKKGETVLFEKGSNRQLAEAKITEIIYEEFDLTIKRGKKLDLYWIKKYKIVDIELDCLYSVKQWKPFYKLDDGSIIKYEYQLYHKYKEE
jgi:hypothetical protein